MICFDKITDIFSIVDEFCKDFDKTTQPFLLGKPSKRPSIMSKSEVITIYLLFHLSGFRCFKHYYIFMFKSICKMSFQIQFLIIVFLELMQSVLLPMTIFAKTCCLGNCTGISFVDSTPIRICKNKQISRNKSFQRHCHYRKIYNGLVSWV